MTSANLCNILLASRHGFVDMCNGVSGLTSFAPIIGAAIDVVVKNEGQFHTLFIITDDQVQVLVFGPPCPPPPPLSLSLTICRAVCTRTILIRVISFVMKATRGINISDDELSPQEEQTMQSISEAR